ETDFNGPPGASEELECTITNRLTGCEIAPGSRWSGDLENAFIEAPMPNLSGGYYYVVTGGKIVEEFDDDTCSHRTYGVSTEVNHAVSEEKASTGTVRISKSNAPDKEAPTCSSFLINGGAETTGEARVTIANEAVDHGGSGLCHMKVWNDDDGEDSAGWQRYRAIVGWELRHEPGTRTVRVRFRDGAMPGNVSEIYSATITLKGRAPTIDSVEPSSARVGEQVVIKGSGFGGGRTGASSVLLNGIAAVMRSWSDTSVTCEIPLGSCTGEVEVFTDTGSAHAEFRVAPAIEKMVPDIAFNTCVLHIENLEGSGFSSDGTEPDVRLTNGPVEIPASNVVVVSPQSITCDFDLTVAGAGYYAVVVKNADGCGDMLNGALLIDSPPR
ncbi:MAG: IPT/TIG domain-containing protein, partial [Actinobacteria bacterium]|nr:IPT/TIG domain-containing protein [Actinomycetota bacterium]